MNRRQFLRQGAGALMLAALSGPAFAEQSTAQSSPAGKRGIRKAIMWDASGLKGPVLDRMKVIKEAGFDGAEMASHMDQDEVLKARDACGLTIPSVCGIHHWGKPLSDPDPKVREAGLEALKQTLRDAKCYGASSVLLVPAVVSKTVSYAEAWERSQAEIRKAIPLAEESGIKIAIENVWNHFLTSPLEAARYVDEFQSAAVEGDNDWPAVMKALDDIGYHGWAIAEPAWHPEGVDPAVRLKQIVEKMDQMLAL